eukprot:8647424-Ditylum_brightwellii.AAC.1
MPPQTQQSVQYAITTATKTATGAIFDAAKAATTVTANTALIQLHPTQPTQPYFLACNETL